MKTATIDAALRYPLTGARAERLETNFTMSMDGIEGDRELVLFDPETHERVSTKKVGGTPNIHRIGATLEDSGIVRATFYDVDGVSPVTLLDIGDPDGLSTEIIEFGDSTPVVEYDKRISDVFSQFLGRSVLLGRKDYDNFAIEPKDRTNAPYHIASKSSLGFASEQTGLSVEELTERYRIGLVLDADDDPFDWQHWQRIELLPGLNMHVTKTTARCEVPSQHELTGKNMKDVAKINNQLPKRMSGGRLKETFGVYAWLDIGGVGYTKHRVGSEVSIQSSHATKRQGV